MKRNNNIPKFDEMMKPLIHAMKLLGGSGSIDEINNKTIDLMRVPNDIFEHKTY